MLLKFASKRSGHFIMSRPHPGLAFGQPEYKLQRAPGNLSCPAMIGVVYWIIRIRG